LQGKQPDLFSLHYVCNSMCWYYLFARYFIVFLESIIEALILFMTNKFTYIKTIVLLFLCKCNTEHAELNLFI